MDTFLDNFLALAEGFSLSDTDKGLYLLSAVRGEARKVLAGLSSTSFKEMAEELCRHFLLTAETYRQQFRDASRNGGESCKGFLARVTHALDNWKALSMLDDWRELFRLEKLFMSVPADLRCQLLERQDTVVVDTVEFADIYLANRVAPRSNLGKNASQACSSSSSAKNSPSKGSKTRPKDQGIGNSSELGSL